MRKFITAGMAVAMLAIPAVASADSVKDTSNWMWNESAQATEQGSTVGELTSQITHNGWWVQGQIADKGGRSAVVQGVQALDGQGRINNSK